MSAQRKTYRGREILDERDGMVQIRLSCGHKVWTTKLRLRELRSRELNCAAGRSE